MERSADGRQTKSSKARQPRMLWLSGAAIVVIALVIIALSPGDDLAFLRTFKPVEGTTTVYQSFGGPGPSGPMLTFTFTQSSKEIRDALRARIGKDFDNGNLVLPSGRRAIFSTSDMAGSAYHCELMVEEESALTRRVVSGFRRLFQR